MSISTISLAHERTTSLAHKRTTSLERLGVYLELTKPRIGLLVLVTVVVAGTVASWGQPEPIALLHAVIGTALVAASGSAMNQWLERSHDALMQRTAERPLPAGTLSSAQVLRFGIVTLVAGLAYLVSWANWQAAGVALLTWVLYVWAYTPLKTRTVWNTAVGAVAGASPIGIGWASAGGSWDLRALALFLIVFLWQFPHFMAIAWIYREQYKRAGIRMLTVADPSGRRAGLQAISGALAVIPVSFLLAAYTWPASLPYIVATILLGSWQLLAALAFFIQRNERSARRLLHVSLIYLPAVLMLILSIPLL